MKFVISACAVQIDPCTLCAVRTGGAVHAVHRDSITDCPGSVLFTLPFRIMQIKGYSIEFGLNCGRYVHTCRVSVYFGGFPSRTIK